jgi:hypothetical protein
MRTESILVIDRGDLKKPENQKSIIDINYTDISGSSDPIRTHAFVIFIDDDMRSKLLKSRYGDNGMIR